MSQKQIKHALVVGGTGMLRACSTALSQRAHVVSVVGRRRQRMERLRRDVAEVGGELHPLVLDYHHTEDVVAALEEAVALYGPIALVVHWSHSSAPDLPRLVAERVESLEQPADFFHVRGSAAADPSRLPRPNGLGSMSNLRYHEVVLGFVLSDRGSRWLTDEEISQGVLDAIAQRSPRYIVGTVKPWSARP